MPVTLEQAKLNAVTATDLRVIDEFRTSAILDLLTFDDVVNPAGGGATLTYSYTRKATLGTASFRAINHEYTPTEATKVPASVELKVLGGSFQIDRVLAKVGPAATGEVAFQMADKIQAAQATFADAVINGDSSSNPDSFDGLSKILAGSTTEVTTALDWSGTMDETKGWGVMDALDDFLALLDGQPGVIIANAKAIARIKAALRRLNLYTETAGPLGQMRPQYGSITLFDAGKKAGTNTDVIPITAGVTSIYAARLGMDGFHGVTTVGSNLVETWMPRFDLPGAVKTGEVEIGPVAVALKKTRAAGVIRNVRLAAA